MKKILIVSLFILSVPLYALEDKVVIKEIKKMGKELKNELRSGMKESPKVALKTCNIKAPVIENKYKDAQLKIGRVSLRNRNPSNVPKAWMNQYISDYHKKTIDKNYVVVNLDGNKNGILKPIVTMPKCLTCHGKHIDPAFNKEIKKLYPNDKATGYSVGEIRGFFWAEYSKSK